MPDENFRLYVIGDIHGRLDLLHRLIDAIHLNADQFGGKILTVTLGDYVDRGPDSRRVIERLMTIRFRANTSGSRVIMKPCSQRFSRIHPSARYGAIWVAWKHSSLWASRRPANVEL